MDNETAKDSDVVKALGLDDASRRFRSLKRVLAVVVLAAVIVGGLAYWLRSDRQPDFDYLVEPIERGDLVVTVTATGTLEPTNQVDVGIEVSGTVDFVAVDFNDRVEAGQLLARLDTTQLNAQVLRSRAAVQVAEAKIEQARATLVEMEHKYTRREQLRDEEVYTPEELDIAEANFLRAKADESAACAALAEAQATLASDEVRLEKASIYSPVDGIVLNRTIETGQTVAATLQTPVLFSLAEDLSEMELHVDVDEADVGQVQAGQRAVFTVDAHPDRSFPAQIERVHFASRTVEGVVTYETVLTVANDELLLRPGMTATADIIVNEIHDATLVSNAALQFTPPERIDGAKQQGPGLVESLLPRPPHRRPERADAGPPRQRNQVWIQEDDTLKPIALELGATDGIRTEVFGDDLQPGMQVVVGVQSQRP